MMSIVSDPNKILRGHQKGDRKEENSRAEMTVTLTEHLLGKLSPGESSCYWWHAGEKEMEMWTQLL